MQSVTHLERVGFGDLPGWAEDDHLAAFEAFRRSAEQALVKPYRSGALGPGFAAFSRAYDRARSEVIATPAAARSFFESLFQPVRIEQEPPGPGFVTGFYEPEVEASPVRTGRFTVPLLSRPSDLADIDDADRPAGMDAYLAFAQRTDAGLAEYPDRAAIEGGALAGRGLEMAWLADKVDAFFVHVQGAARLLMTDGTVRRVTYAAKSGQRFTGPGRVLVDSGEIAPEQVSMQTIRAWLAAHPERVDAILQQNRSYIFFRDAPVSDPGLGPIAAAKVQLTPGRSIAVDRLLHTFGTPFYLDAPTLDGFGERPFRRLMVAQDTGSAIVGPARADLFTGSGHAAGEIAGVIKHPATFFALWPLAAEGP